MLLRACLALQWNKLPVAVGAEKPHVLVHDGALVVVWTTNGRLARIQQTADMRMWLDMPMPADHRSMEFSSVASHDASLYLQCFDGGHWSFILKYNEEVGVNEYTEHSNIRSLGHSERTFVVLTNIRTLRMCVRYDKPVKTSQSVTIVSHTACNREVPHN
eukprot:scpid93427/ scgid1875/ 